MTSRIRRGRSNTPNSIIVSRVTFWPHGGFKIVVVPLIAYRRFFSSLACQFVHSRSSILWCSMNAGSCGDAKRSCIAAPRLKCPPPCTPNTPSGRAGQWSIAVWNCVIFVADMRLSIRVVFV